MGAVYDYTAFIGDLRISWNGPNVLRNVNVHMEHFVV